MDAIFRHTEAKHNIFILRIISLNIYSGCRPKIINEILFGLTGCTCVTLIISCSLNTVFNFVSHYLVLFHGWSNHLFILFLDILILTSFKQIFLACRVCHLN